MSNGLFLRVKPSHGVGVWHGMAFHVPIAVIIDTRSVTVEVRLQGNAYPHKFSLGRASLTQD